MTAPPTPDSTSTRGYKCPWCLRTSDAGSTSCPSCGAPVDLAATTSDAGWVKQPPIKDMAKIQFGQSFCQIQGAYVPVADFKLAPEDGLYFSHHLLLWKDDSATISVMPMRDGWKRIMAGMPLIMTQAVGPGRIAFSKDYAGEVIALPLDAGQSIDVQEHRFMVATTGISYDWFDPNTWFDVREDKEYETILPLGFAMDRFTATDKPGLLLLHGEGNVFVRHLSEGQSILVKPKALLYKDTTVRSNLHFEHSGRLVQSRYGGTRNHRFGWIRLQGPGRVAIQSKYEHMEDPGTRIIQASPDTTSDTPGIPPPPRKASLLGCVIVLIFLIIMLIIVPLMIWLLPHHHGHH